MSFEERPDFKALVALEEVLGHFSEELASWRRRAHRAEAERTELGDYDKVAARERVLELEAENRELRGRVTLARERVNELLMRLRFLEEQIATEEAVRER